MVSSRTFMNRPPSAVAWCRLSIIRPRCRATIKWFPVIWGVCPKQCDSPLDMDPLNIWTLWRMNDDYKKCGRQIGVCGHEGTCRPVTYLLLCLFERPTIWAVDVVHLPVSGLDSGHKTSSIGQTTTLFFSTPHISLLHVSPPRRLPPRRPSTQRGYSTYSMWLSSGNQLA